ncbi:MAG TPA: threonine--tRNA ligase [Candidatus Goldiibacteriota bacterium]|nr:threonine--tRNA ligase [Candidatus Goldiibacteriota bacterium]
MEKIRIKYKNIETEEKENTLISEFLKQNNVNPDGIIAVKIGGKLFDLKSPITESGELKEITFSDKEGKEVYWHSTSHIMAAAVKRLYPDVKVTIGPAVEEGFYYDFDKDKPFTEEELSVIEKEMQKIIDEGKDFIREEMSREEAIKLFKEAGEDYKVEIINEIKDDKVSIYKTGEFVDLCRGPHVTNTKKIGSFKLLKVAGAYWRGNEKNKMLQRIYGISFPEKKMLEEYLQKIEEAKQRDHRKLGRELDLFSTHDEFGPGLVYWHPKGAIVRKEIEDFWRAEHLKRGYELLYTPHVAKIDLWHKSGHTGFYKENMYPSMIMDDYEYLIKPMNCPFHILIYKTGMKSYRDLPLRWAELGTVYRYEKSGVLHGLMRVRGFTQDDAHIFMMEEQLESELENIIDMTIFILKTFGFNEYEIFLSTRPEKDYIGDKAIWDKSEAALKSVLNKTGLPYSIDEGGGAFYGPKIDIKIKDALNRTWQCSTIQVDFNLPERFDVNYVGKDGKEHRVVMVHRALLGSFERFFGVLIEHYKGSFPVWLSPVQIKILTINEKVIPFADSIYKKYRDAGIRIIVDDENEKIGAKIRRATMEKVPYMFIIGEKEVTAKTVSLRLRTGQETKGINPDNFLADILRKIKNKDVEI